MVSFTPLSPETEADRRLYLDDRLVPVSCRDCLATVGVTKHSAFHTSIQWTVEAQAHCAEFARRDAEVGGRVVHESCSRMRASIDDAVRAGRLPVDDAAAEAVRG